MKKIIVSLLLVSAVSFYACNGCNKNGTTLLFPDNISLNTSQVGNDDFNKTILDIENWMSKSLTKGDITNFNGEIQAGKLYNILGEPLALNEGHTTFFIGTRKQDYPKNDFLSHLSKHVGIVANAFIDKGLKGYIVLASDDYEAAIMTWGNVDQMNAAVNTEGGKAVLADANSFLKSLVFEKLKQ